VVIPLYEVVSKGGGQKPSAETMGKHYDDFNEFFWCRGCAARRGSR
jgi:hypothetical protein